MSYYLASSLKLLRDEVNKRWPNRSKVSDGWIGDTAHSNRVSDHNPDWSAGGVVRALDITSRDIDVNLVLKHTTNDSRVAYVIHNHRIYTHSRGWYAYNGSNPHTSHIHVSIAHTRTAERDTKSWFGSTGKAQTTQTPTTEGITLSEANRIIDHINERTTITLEESTQNALHTGIEQWSLGQLVELIARRVGRTDGRVHEINQNMVVTLNEPQQKALATGVETWDLADLTARLTHRIGYTFQRVAALRDEIEELKSQIEELKGEHHD